MAIGKGIELIREGEKGRVEKGGGGQYHHQCGLQLCAVAVAVEVLKVGAHAREDTA